MDKIILINKPSGWTSSDVVIKIKSTYKYKKVGHAGTLDPLATGLLIVGYDEGTKLLGKLILDSKEYEATIAFGSKTKTGDMSSEIIETKSSNLTKLNILDGIKHFKEIEYMQKPHLYSAVKINGVKAYDLARKNIIAEIQPKLVKINEINLIDFDEKNQIAKIKLNVSKGFYVRSFAEDLANYLGTLGHLVSLNRTKCGDFDLKDAIPLNIYLKKYN